MSNELQNKLFNYEATPSENAWPAILTALNEKPEAAFEKLFEYEEEPKPIIWNKISKELDAAPTSHIKVVPMYSKYSKAFRLGFAAAVLGLIALGISYLFTNNSSSNIAINKSNSNSSQNPDNTVIRNEKGISKNSKVQQFSNSASENDKSLTKNIKGYASSAGKLVSNRYTTIENGKGKTVRLSKKVIPLFDCADNNKASNNISCKENIQNLQQK
ncbi:MAG TPA: hypothetical protein VM888_08330, partial [Chitinophagaceae bacterium]|nr:hypothetical protein [Chitinophagaceae bacterium]